MLSRGEAKLIALRLIGTLPGKALVRKECADALLAVQDETARECAEIADECAEYGNIVGRAVADNLMLEIRARFGLEEK